MDQKNISALISIISYSLDILVKNLGKGNFNYLRKEFDSMVLDLVKQKILHPYEYISVF